MIHFCWLKESELSPSISVLLGKPRVFGSSRPSCISLHHSASLNTPHTQMAKQIQQCFFCSQMKIFYMGEPRFKSHFHNQTVTVEAAVTFSASLPLAA